MKKHKLPHSIPYMYTYIYMHLNSAKELLSKERIKDDDNDVKVTETDLLCYVPHLYVTDFMACVWH